MKVNPLTSSFEKGHGNEQDQPASPPLIEDTWRDRASFLYAAISDRQEILRAVDAKINILMAMHLAVLPLILRTFKFSTELAHHLGKDAS